MSHRVFRMVKLLERLDERLDPNPRRPADSSPEQEPASNFAASYFLWSPVSTAKRDGDLPR
jgi:hypothetical protein